MAEGLIACWRSWFKIKPLDKLAGVLRPVVPIHPRVMPVHRQGALIADGIQGADGPFPVDAAVPWGPGAPSPPRVAVRKVSTEQTATPVQSQGHVVNMHMINAL